MEQQEVTVELYHKWKYQSDIDSPFNWMINDLSRGIQTNSNYLVAIGLFAYSEAIGRIIANDSKINNWKCFDAFTKEYVCYTNLTKKIWEDIRHGLAHNYFIKNGSWKISIDRTKSIGFEIVTKNLYVNVYFEDFKKGVEKYLDKQKSGIGLEGLSTSFKNFHNGRGFTGPPPPLRSNE